VNYRYLSGATPKNRVLNSESFGKPQRPETQI
jgi:hypothetical protein